MCARPRSSLPQVLTPPTDTSVFLRADSARLVGRQAVLYTTCKLEGTSAVPAAPWQRLWGGGSPCPGRGSGGARGRCCCRPSLPGRQRAPKGALRGAGHRAPPRCRLQACGGAASAGLQRRHHLRRSRGSAGRRGSKGLLPQLRCAVASWQAGSAVSKARWCARGGFDSRTKGALRHTHGGPGLDHRDR